MKMIINWFKKNLLTKTAMILAVAVGVLEIVVGTVELGCSHLVMALLLYLIIAKDKTLNDVYELLDSYSKQNMDSFVDLLRQIKEKKYWISRYLLEKLKLDFCKRSISLKEFLDELPKMEETVRRNHAELFDKYK